MNMVKYVKDSKIDQNNRINFWLINFDYIDGNDLIAKLFKQEFSMDFDEKIDGIWFSKIRVYDKNVEYELVWHEDVGNYMYSIQQDEETISKLEQRLIVIISKINEMINKRKDL